MLIVRLKNGFQPLKLIVMYCLQHVFRIWCIIEKWATLTRRKLLFQTSYISSNQWPQQILWTNTLQVISWRNMVQRTDRMEHPGRKVKELELSCLIMRLLLMQFIMILPWKVIISNIKCLLSNSSANWLTNSKDHMKYKIPIVVAKIDVRLVCRILIKLMHTQFVIWPFTRSNQKVITLFICDWTFDLLAH